MVAGIRKATSWYNTHIALSHPPIRGQAIKKLPTVVLMTEDAANRQKGEKAGITCISGMGLVSSRISVSQ
jgi:exosome complex exonuclease DIS3/RRP44